MKARFKVVGPYGAEYTGTGPCYLRDNKDENNVHLVGIAGLGFNDNPVQNSKPFPSRHAARRWVTAYNKSKAVKKHTYSLWRGGSGAWYSNRYDGEKRVKLQASYYPSGRNTNRDEVVAWTEAQQDFGGWVRAEASDELVPFRWNLPSVAYIHVLKAVVGTNKLNNENNPVVRVVRPDGTESMHHEVKVNGPSLVVYSRDRTCPGAPGVECWIEAQDSDVEVVL